MDDTLTIIGHPNSIHRRRPREPLVQILYSSGLGDVNSIVFTPGEAAKIITAIRKAARSAAAGVKRKRTEITLLGDRT